MSDQPTNRPTDDDRSTGPPEPSEVPEEDRATVEADAAPPADAPDAGGDERAPAAADDTEAPEGEEAPDGDRADGGDRATAEAGEPDDDLRAAAEKVEVDLEALLEERAQYLEAYQRAQADFENYRKQVQRRQQEAINRALGSFVESLLPVLDACDAALAQGADAVEPVLSALYGALSKEGLERIDPEGKPFDPNEAEAVVHEPGDGGEHVVAEVLRPGYRWRGQVLRPAMVKVTD